MQIQELIKAYQAKGDEELLRLAASREDLTVEARNALESELSRRKITAAVESCASRNDESRRSAGPSESGPGARDPECQGLGGFLAEVVRTYRTQFWLFFRITAPSVLISTAVIITGRHEVRDIARPLHLDSPLSALRIANLEMLLVSFSSYFIGWLATSFSFGAICIAVEESAAGFSVSAWHSVVSLRERWVPLFRLSLLLFALTLVAGAAAGLLSIGMFWAWRHWPVRISPSLIWFVSYGFLALAGLVWSRFALAVPAVILDDCSVGQAMLRSDELTEGKWLTLAALLAKSVVGGYVAAKCPFWVASFIPGPLPSWFSWTLTGASIVGVAAVEPTMFVGFALLYLKTTAIMFPPRKEERTGQTA